MTEKFPYLAGQINGPIALTFGKAIDSTYEIDAEFIDFISQISIDTLEGEWLDKLGLLLGLPRPWVEVPLIQEAFLFDNIPAVVPNPRVHALSTDRNIVIEGQTITPSMGGKLDDTNRSVSVEPITDTVYRDYLRCACLVKKQHSINGIADVVEVFSGSKQYVIEYLSDSEWLNDVLVKLPIRMLDYQETLQNAFDNMFTTSPKVIVRIDASFDSEYITPDVSNTVYNIVGNNSYSVTNFTELDNLIVDVTLGSINAEYKDEVQRALDEEYADYDDIIVSVTVRN